MIVLVPLAGAQGKASDHWNAKNADQAISVEARINFHKKFAQSYREDANRLDTQAKAYAEMAETHRKSLTLHKQEHPMSKQIAAVCEALAVGLQTNAHHLRELADIHGDIADLIQGREDLPNDSWID